MTIDVVRAFTAVARDLDQPQRFDRAVRGLGLCRRAASEYLPGSVLGVHGVDFSVAHHRAVIIRVMVDTKLTKSAGEHHVCAVLSRLGWGAALTRDGLERTDILAVSTGQDRRVIEVQVKAANGASPKTSWPLGSNSQQVALSDTEWFVFVALPPNPVEPPRSFTVPRNVVAAAAWIVHQNWLTDQDAGEGKRNVGVDRARVALSYWEGYENRWDLLDRSAYDAPVLLPAAVREAALLDRVGLPPGHPWNDRLPNW